jgi:hypothetical protein
LEQRVLGIANLQLAAGLTAAVLARRRKVLPEQAMVGVATAVEVEQGRNRGRLGEVALVLGLGNRVECAVEAVDVCLVVLRVVQLHDLARDVRLEGGVVICVGRPLVSQPWEDLLRYLA